MATAEQTDPFDVLMAFIIEAGKLGKKDASIYTLGLKKGVITSGDIVDANIIPRQSTAADRLRKLANAGYFEPELKDADSRGKGRARKFRASPPETVLSELLDMYHGVNQVLETLNEHREVMSEADPVDDRIWLMKPQKAAMRQAAAIIENAQTSVKIYSHDCSWFRITAITNALKKASDNNVSVTVIATKLAEQTTKWLTKTGAAIHTTDFPSVPYCLIDDSTLLLPCNGGVLGNDYQIIKTRQNYLVKCFLEMFETIIKNAQGGD